MIGGLDTAGGPLRRRSIPSLALASLLLSGPAAGQHQEPEVVLIRDVVLAGQDGGNVNDDATVSILVRDGELDIVTEEIVPASEASLAVDAQQGFLLGTLDPGQPPSFVILDTDPRGSFDTLLDTRAHTRFAMRDGVVIVNVLPRVDPDDADEQRRTGWLAYTPPPLALPVSYQDTTKWNQFETAAVNGLLLGAIAIDRQRWLSQDAANEEQVGDLSPFEGGEVRAVRFGVVGTLNFPSPWVFTLAGATNAFDQGFDTTKTDDITLFDYRLDIPFGRRAALSIGKQKEPISMERLMGMVYEPMQERSVASDGLLPSRNVGVVLNSTLPGERMTYAIGWFNDWFDAGEAFNESARQVVGRVTGLPLVSADESTILHLGFGVRHTDARQGLRFRTEPEFNQAPDFVDTAPVGADTGLFAADWATAYNVELSARSGPVWVSGEYLATAVRSSTVGDPTFTGAHLAASWILTGEMRGYNRRSGTLGRVPVARPVTRGGWGAWELGLRWSELDLDDQDVTGGTVEVRSAGISWWPTALASVTMNYRDIRLDRSGTTGRARGLMARILLVLE